MKKLNIYSGLVLPLDRANVDTDAIIPKKFLKSIKRTGYGVNLFYQWRYLSQGNQHILNTDFVLNQSKYKGATILLARENFGCGSSREHAVWALVDYGFRIIIASSFADIFYSNSIKNGILPLTLDKYIINELFSAVEDNPGYRLTVNLEKQMITTPDDREILFQIDSFEKHSLLNGLDDISLTMQYQDKIKAYEVCRVREVPWVFETE